MKYFYTDALKAAHMSKEFGVEYDEKFNFPHFMITTTFGKVGMKEDGTEYGSMGFAVPEKYNDTHTIHKSSLHIFEPQVGDMCFLKLNFGNLAPCYIHEVGKKKTTVRRCLNDYERAREKFNNEDIGDIIQRNGVAFFMPEAKE